MENSAEDVGGNAKELLLNAQKSLETISGISVEEINLGTYEGSFRAPEIVLMSQNNTNFIERFLINANDYLVENIKGVKLTEAFCQITSEGRKYKLRLDRSSLDKARATSDSMSFFEAIPKLISHYRLDKES